MATVKNLKIQEEEGVEDKYFATWEFSGKTSSSGGGGSSSIKLWSYVKVKPGSKWYNGVGIASFVFNDTWQIIELRGDRAVLGRNPSGTNNIISPIHVSNLIAAGKSVKVDTRANETVDTVDHYKVEWWYWHSGTWFKGTTEDVPHSKDGFNSKYSPPDNAIKIWVGVTPVAKTRKVNNQDTPYWSGTRASKELNLSETSPNTPPNPKVDVEDYTISFEINNVDDPQTDAIEFEIYNADRLYSSTICPVLAAMAAGKQNVEAGGEYRLRARALNYLGGNYETGVGGASFHSAWTAFTDKIATIPNPPAEITTIRGTSSTSVYLDWPEVVGADTYNIEYTTKLKYFDNSSETTTVSNIEFNHYEVTGLEDGGQYFFRVNAVNEKGESSWTEPKSVVIGKKPEAPTTWSSSTTVITGDTLTLYWVHNSEDGSSETYAEVETTIDGILETHTIKNENIDDEELKDKTKSYVIDTSGYKEGTKVDWRVRTAGITLQYGDWSIMRHVDVYAPPTLSLNLTNQNGDPIEVLTSFPCYIKGLAGPKTQMPIGYHVNVIANQGYETVDSVGRTKVVNAGDSVYSSHIDSNDPLLVELSANNIDLENGIEYLISVTATMNSGLNVTTDKTFTVLWTDEQYGLDAEIRVDLDTYIAYITPYCMNFETEEYIPGVSLSVYRREFDGTYTEIAKGVDSMTNTVVVDPHPALDYARYRIVATANDTGAVSFYDPPGYPMNVSGVILQWAEAWTSYDIQSPDETMVHPQWNGSLLHLPFNADISDNNTAETSLVRYIGRSYPVSYYGTQIESKATWNVEIPKSDEETLYALRRLAIWKGDVYVRESSGSGYWANVAVSFSQKHTALTVPVTINVARVEGGM